MTYVRELQRGPGEWSLDITPPIRRADGSARLPSELERDDRPKWLLGGVAQEGCDKPLRRD